MVEFNTKFYSFEETDINSMKRGIDYLWLMKDGTIRQICFQYNKELGMYHADWFIENCVAVADMVEIIGNFKKRYFSLAKYIDGVSKETANRVLDDPNSWPILCAGKPVDIDFNITVKNSRGETQTFGIDDEWIVWR